MPKIILEEAGIAIHTYDHRDLDPLTATQEQLRINGVPSQPQDQVLLRLWNKALSNHKRYIIPEFKVTDRKRDTDAGGIVNLAQGVSNIWSGSVAKPPAGQSFSWIEGRWIVPNCYPSDGTNTCAMVQWIGLGGVGTALFQAGTESFISFSGGKENLVTTAWFEWWPDIPIIAINNFNVSVGDTVWFMLCASSTSKFDGTVFAQNVGTGDSTSFTVQSLESGKITGPLVADTAEWVVERPSYGGILPLAKYTLAYFDEGKAQSMAGSPGNWTSNGATSVIDFSEGITMNMTSDGTTTGTLLSEVEVKTTQSLETDWVAAQ